MAESSEGANNSNEQEMDAGMDQHSAPCDLGGLGEVLLLGDVPDGAGPEGARPAPHVQRLLQWIHQAGGHADDADEAASQAERDMDALLGLVYVLVLETGFLPLGSDDGFEAHPRGVLQAFNLRRVRGMPRGWRSGDATAGPRYVLDFALGREDTASARLVGVVCSGTLIVNMIANEADAAYSLVLVPSDYVRRGALRNLRALSLAVKDMVSVRARAAVMNARGVTNPSLLGMPAELLAMLAGALPVRDVYHLAATCTALQHLLDDAALWRHQVRRQHPALFAELEAREAQAVPVDWKEEFRLKHAEEAAAAAARTRALMRSAAPRCGFARARSRWLDSL